MQASKPMFVYFISSYLFRGHIAEPLIAAFEQETEINCEELTGLSRNQRSLCDRYVDHMVYVGEGARNGIAECQWQLKSQRWNCSTSTNPELFKKMMKIGWLFTTSCYFSFDFTASISVNRPIMTKE